MAAPIGQLRWVWLLLISFLVLSGCGGNRYAEDIQYQHKALVVKFNELKQKLNGNHLRNAVIARDYAKTLVKYKPEMATIAVTLKKDTTSEGVMYQSLQQRLNKVNQNPQREDEYRKALSEILSLDAGSDSVIFNESLIDIVNTLADLSDGILPRINIPKSSSAEKSAPGSYLVGNPNYGSWQKESSGSSFWQFYGQYALFRDLMRPSYGYNGGGQIYRDSWYDRPQYSYHHDYGRSTYGTASQQKTWDRTAKDLRSSGKKVVTNKKDYRSSSAKRRSSTYKQMASKQYGAKSASSSKSSASAKRPSTYSQYGSSSRGTSSGSRSFRGGK